MKKTIATPAVEVAVEQNQTQPHPLQKSYMFVSKGHVDYNNLSAFEAVSMSAVMVLAVLVGVIQTSALV
jgi:hypothetical protein